MKKRIVEIGVKVVVAALTVMYGPGAPVGEWTMDNGQWIIDNG